MFQANTRRRIAILLAATAQIITGCGDEDARVAQVAQQAAERQAGQNHEMAQLNREVAEGTRRLIQTRGETDQQLLLQGQNLQKQRDALEQERRDIANDRLRESVLASALVTIGELAICSLPLVLCWFLLSRLAKESAEIEVSEALIDSMVGEPDWDRSVSVSTEADDTAKLTAPVNR